MRDLLRAACAVLLCAAPLGACGGETEAPTIEPEPEVEAPAETPEAAPTPEAPPAAPAAAEEPSPVVEDPSFELRAEPAEGYTATEEGSFAIRLTPRGNYHVNMEYPMNIQLSAPEGAGLGSSSLERGDADEYTEQRAAFTVPFVPSEAGEHTVTAEVDFAVCTPEACMPEQRTLALVLPVTGTDPAAGE